MDISYITAQRISDILNIHITDIKEDGLYIQQSKTKKKLVFEITDELAEVVQAARSLKRPVQGLYLFSNRRGQKYTYDGFSTMWQRAVRKAGIENVHFHDIRAKATTDAKRMGRDAQLLAGHQTSSMTDYYIKQR